MREKINITIKAQLFRIYIKLGKKIPAWKTTSFKKSSFKNCPNQKKNIEYTL